MRPRDKVNGYDLLLAWQTGHRGRNKRSMKIRHRYFLGAWVHAWRLGRRRGAPFKVYGCQWDDDPFSGRTARRHWHVGGTWGVTK